MPSTTFFHLPPEKQERLLTAARAEFGRVSYSEASINQIIRRAGIPRGSFYMYFTGKEELFHYLMRSYGEELEQRMLQLLAERKGDLFAAFLALFDHGQAHWGQEKYGDLVRILHQNKQLQPEVFWQECFLQRLREGMDLSLLDLRQEEDLANLFRLLIPVVGRALITAVQSGRGAEMRAQLVAQFELLKRGVAKKTAP